MKTSGGGYAPILQVPDAMLKVEEPQAPDGVVKVREPKAHAPEELETPVGALCCVCMCGAGGIVCMVMCCILVGKWSSLNGGERAGVAVMFFYGLGTCLAILLGIYSLLIALCDGPPARKRVPSVPAA